MSSGGFKPKPPENDRLQGYRQIALATTIPLIMLAAPAVGYFLGSYLDSLLGTSNILMVVFLLLGVAAGGVESYRIIKKIIKEGE
jgi:F0F1-type ATP synthase assembly protein I